MSTETLIEDDAFSFSGQLTFAMDERRKTDFILWCGRGETAQVHFQRSSGMSSESPKSPTSCFVRRKFPAYGAPRQRDLHANQSRKKTRSFQRVLENSC